MQVVEKYSHLNGEEFLIVHHLRTYEEILDVIGSVDATNLKTKVSKEKTMPGRHLYSPKELNSEFKRLFSSKGWGEERYRYCVTTNHTLMQELVPLAFREQKQL